jgi:FkbM family methyltransferase
LNRIERAVDGLDPGLSVRLRAMKMRIRRDPDRQLIQDMMPRGGVGVDIGANRGVYTYLMAAQAGAAGHVHAVEPFPAHGDRLRTLARRLGNVTVHPAAASDHSGHEELRIPVHGGHPIDALATLEAASPGTDGQHPEERCQVPVRTLDELLAGERPVSLLKCDVEGHEHQVFRGAAGVLARDRPAVFVEIEQRHRQDSIDTTFELFADAGYRGWFVTRGRLLPLEKFDLGRDQLDYLNDEFVPYEMPDGYVTDFLFCPEGTDPPPTMRPA